MNEHILYLKCFAAVILGFAAHFAVKFDENKKLHITANEEYSFAKFLREAVASHILNAICILIWTVAMPDAIKEYPKISDLKWIGICAVIGYANSSIVLAVLGSGKKYIMGVIDKKTNIADGKQAE